MKTLFKLIIIGIVLPNVSHGQCVNTIAQSCGVYEKCFAKYCPCAEGPAEYFLSYGEKYCQAFLKNSSFSPAGIKWRESTLRCLQETIVPKLDISPTPQCNCREMKDFAFSSHVSCYTKTDASICDLPVTDVNEIRKTIDLKDMFSRDGWKQMHEVSKVCAVDAPDDGRRAIWEALEKILHAR